MIKNFDLGFTSAPNIGNYLASGAVNSVYIKEQKNSFCLVKSTNVCGMIRVLFGISNSVLLSSVPLQLSRVSSAVTSRHNRECFNYLNPIRNAQYPTTQWLITKYHRKRVFLIQAADQGMARRHKTEMVPINVLPTWVKLQPPGHGPLENLRDTV